MAKRPLTARGALGMAFIFLCSFAGFGGWWMWDYHSLERSGIQTEGEVVRLRWRGRKCQPTIAFTTRVGVRATHSPMGWHNPCVVQAKGQRVPVTYALDDPSRAHIRSAFWGTRFPMIFVIVGVGLAFLFTGVAVLMRLQGR